MSEQKPQVAEQAQELNSELQARREKLAVLRERELHSLMISAVRTFPTSCMPSLTVKRMKS